MTKSLNVGTFGALCSLITSLMIERDNPLDGFDCQKIQSLVLDCIDTGEFMQRMNADKLDNILYAIKNNNKLEAIKAYHSLTGCGLKESEDAIEASWLNLANPQIRENYYTMIAFLEAFSNLTLEENVPTEETLLEWTKDAKRLLDKLK